MVGAVTDALSADGVAAAVDLHFVPFGNTYFPTRKCPGPSGDTGIHCWAPECWQSMPGNWTDADCFTGVPNCQHGMPECDGNSIEACAMKLHPKVSDFWPFVSCFEGKHGGNLSEAPRCATAAGLDWSAIDACYRDAAQRKALDAAAAIDTLRHNCGPPDNPGGCRPGFTTPDVYVNDELVSKKEVFKAICRAINNTAAVLPAGCRDGRR